MQSVKMEQGTEQGEAADPVTLTDQELSLVGGTAGGQSGSGHAAIGFGVGSSGSGSAVIGFGGGISGTG